MHRHDRVSEPAIARLIHVLLCAERALILDPFCALIHERSVFAAKGLFFFIGLNQVLSNFGADFLKQETDMSDKRVVFRHGVLVLAHIMHTQRGQRAKDNKQHEQPIEPNAADQAKDGQSDNSGKHAIAFGGQQFQHGGDPT